MRRDKIIKECIERHINNSTPAEQLMSAKLRFHNIEFFREWAVLTEKSFFTADFYIPKHGLLIEIDGEYHQSQKQIEKDVIKDIVYKSFGYHVLRIKNHEVDTFDTNYIKRYKRKTISKYKMPCLLHYQTQKKNSVEKLNTK